MTEADVVVRFWREAGYASWFNKRAAFDAEIKSRFEPAHHAAARGELAGWAETPEGTLALLLLLDQFPRNLFRGSAHAFASDPLARQTTRAGIALGFDMATPVDLRLFFYLPLTHSEDPVDQAQAVLLTEALERAGGENARAARVHRDIIARFGRFPHRNAALGRETTDEEQAFLDAGGFAG